MWQAHLLRSVVVTRRALYQRPEGRDACVPWARGVDAGGAAMAWSSLQCLLSCIGFEIIKAHKYFVTFCDLLICHYPSRPHPLFLEILVASEKKQTWACSPTVGLSLRNYFNFKRKAKLSLLCQRSPALTIYRKFNFRVYSIFWINISERVEKVILSKACSMVSIVKWPFILISSFYYSHKKRSALNFFGADRFWCRLYLCKARALCWFFVHNL